MPLYIENNLYKKDISVATDFLESYSETKSKSQNFLDNSTPKVFTASDRILYAAQREFVCISENYNQDNYKWIASDDATTCHLVTLINYETKSLCIGHIDGYKTNECLSKMVETITKLCADKECFEPRLELCIFGGFIDRKGYSKSLLTEILQFVTASSINFTLDLCCTYKMNSHFDSESDIYTPIITGIAVNINTLEKVICKCPVEIRGPDMILRHSKSYSDNQSIANIYDVESNCIVINPFNYIAPRNAFQLLSLDDDTFLQYSSTSPHCEPDHFLKECKRTIIFMLENPNPWKNIFNGKARYYRLMSDGQYILQ